MRPRRKSLFSRAVDVVPVFAVVGIGIAGVFVAMNVLVTAPPLAIERSPSPSISELPSLPGSPSALPFVTATTPVTPAPSASLPDFRPTYVHSAVSATDPNGAWTVYLSYPAFVEGTTPWAAAIDADLLNEFQARAEQWEQGPAANREVAGKVNTLSSTFTTELLTPALASFTVIWVDDSSPGEPAKMDAETLNYDLSTGQRMGFGDMFIDSEAALAIVSTQSLSLLQEQLGADFDPAIAVDGTSPSPSHYVNWALTPDGLKITFAENQVSSRGPALPVVVVPWDSLRAVLVPTGPVAKIAGL